ncbi:hypothetical protein LINGRAHAP2_LOCUS15156 [Linum grandiflorum]
MEHNSSVWTSIGARQWLQIRDSKGNIQGSTLEVSSSRGIRLVGRRSSPFFIDSSLIFP